MKKIEIHDDFLIIHFSGGGFNEFIAFMRSPACVGRKFDPIKRVNTLPLKASSIKAIEHLRDEFSFKLSPTVLEWLSQSEGIDLTGFTGTLLPFQQDSLEYILRRLDSNGVLVAHPPGAGKTIIAIATIQALRNRGFKKQVLIVTPAAPVIDKWQESIEAWLPNETVTRYKVSVAGSIVLTTWANIPTGMWASLGMCVFDEAHYIQDETTIRSKRTLTLCKGTQYTLMLTGTPFKSMPAQLIPILTGLDVVKEVFGGYVPYIERYCAGYQKEVKRNFIVWDKSGSSNLLELNNKLHQTCMTRVPKEQVMQGQLPVRKTVLEFEMDAKTLKKYKECEADVVKYLKKYKESPSFVASHLVQLTELLRLSGIGKVDGVITWLEDWIESSNEKIIVFTRHRQVMTAIADHFNALGISGKTPSKRRLQIIEEFNTPSQQLLIGQTLAMGTGVDGLQTNCNHILFVEFPFTPAAEEQAIGRLYRLGQKSQVNVNYAQATSIDSFLLNLLEIKQASFDEAINGIMRLLPELITHETEIYLDSTNETYSPDGILPA